MYFILSSVRSGMVGLPIFFVAIQYSFPHVSLNFSYQFGPFLSLVGVHCLCQVFPLGIPASPLFEGDLFCRVYRSIFQPSHISSLPLRFSPIISRLVSLWCGFFGIEMLHAFLVKVSTSSLPLVLVDPHSIVLELKSPPITTGLLCYLLGSIALSRRSRSSFGGKQYEYATTVSVSIYTKHVPLLRFNVLRCSTVRISAFLLVVWVKLLSIFLNGCTVRRSKF